MSSSLLRDHFPQLYFDSQYLPKITPECLPLLHRLPYSSMRSIELVRENSSGSRHVLMLPRRAKGRVIERKVETTRKWVKENGQHVVRDEITEDKICEPVNHPLELTCGSRGINECPRYSMALLNSNTFAQQEFMDDGNLIFIGTSWNGHMFSKEILTIFRPHATEPEIKEISLLEVGAQCHECYLVLCPDTKCLWMLDVSPDTSFPHLFKSNSIYDEHIDFVEKMTMPFRNKKACNPQVSIKKSQYWEMTMDDGNLYVYCGDRKLFYLRTRHIEFSRIVPSSPGEEHKEVYIWYNLKLLHGTHLLTRHSLHNYSIVAHQGKVYVCGGYMKHRNLSRVGPNTQIYVWDLHRRSLSTLDLNVSKTKHSIAFVQNSLFIVGGEDWKMYLIEILLREKMPYSQVVGSSFSDVDVYCKEGPSCERIPLVRGTDDPLTVHQVEIRNENSIVAHPVEGNAMRFMQNYAEKHGHAMPQFVGDGYAHLSGNVDPRLRYTSTSYSYSSMDTTTDGASAVNAKPTKKKLQKKSRKRSKKMLTHEEYLQEVKDAEYDLISPMVGDDLMVIFEALDDPEVEFL